MQAGMYTCALGDFITYQSPALTGAACSNTIPLRCMNAAILRRLLSSEESAFNFPSLQVPLCVARLACW